MARKEGDKEKKASSRSKLGVAAGSGVQSSGTKGGTAKHGKLSKGERKKAAQERRKGAKPVKQTYWAVQVGRAPGVYTDLDEYEKQVKGFPGAKAKKFKTQRLADAFVANVDKAGAKKEKKRKKAAASNSAEAGATAKATKVEFWAVRVGRIPGVYTSLERVQEQVHGFSGADYKKFKLEHEAQAYAGVVSEPILLGDADDVVSLAASTVRFDRTDMPRRFALGFTRDAGKTTLTQGPQFGLQIEAPAYIEAPRPVANAAASTAAEEDASFGLAVSLTDERVTDAAPPAEDEADGAPARGVFDGDFVGLGGSTESDSDDADERNGVTAQEAASASKTEWADHELPWYRANMFIGSPSLRLHNEIVELTTLLRPTPKEDEQRREAHGLLQGVIESVFPGATLDIFGSFATGLHLPTSDVDCVILGSDVADWQVATALQGLGRALQQKEWVSDLEVVAKAKVPIIKLVVMPYGLKFDISIGKSNGLEAVELIKGHLRDWPVLRPLVTILKLYLLQRNMNEVYTGGLSSFALIISVVAFLQMHQSRVAPLTGGRRKAAAAGELDQNLGLLLIDYFRFYGRALKYQAVGVSCAGGGACYDKESKGFGKQPRDKSERFSVMDPLDSSNDVSRGAFNSFLVRSSFDHAYNMLTAPKETRSKPMLSMILRLNEVLAIRPPPLPAHARAARPSGSGALRRA